MYTNSDLDYCVFVRPSETDKRHGPDTIAWDIEPKMASQKLDRFGNQIPQSTNFQGEKYRFSLKDVFGENTYVSEIYKKKLKPVIQHIFDNGNQNIVIFSYGQKHSGKTHCIYGEKGSPGLIQPAVTDIFNIIKTKKINSKYRLKLSHLIIYNEKIIDILGDLSNNIDIVIDEVEQSYINGLTEEIIASPSQLFSLISEITSSEDKIVEILEHKIDNSITVSLITIEFYDEEKDIYSVFNKLFFVDLCHSDPVKFMNNQQLYDTEMYYSFINIINILSELNNPVTFIDNRDSTLSLILFPKPVVNVHILVVCNIVCHFLNLEETINTLLFASTLEKVICDLHLVKEYEDSIISTYQDINITSDSRILSQMKNYVKRADSSTFNDVEFELLNKIISKSELILKRYSFSKNIQIPKSEALSYSRVIDSYKSDIKELTRRRDRLKEDYRLMRPIEMPPPRQSKGIGSPRKKKIIRKKKSSSQSTTSTPTTIATSTPDTINPTDTNRPSTITSGDLIEIEPLTVNNNPFKPSEILMTVDNNINPGDFNDSDSSDSIEITMKVRKGKEKKKNDGNSKDDKFSNEIKERKIKHNQGSKPNSNNGTQLTFRQSMLKSNLGSANSKFSSSKSHTSYNTRISTPSPKPTHQPPIKRSISSATSSISNQTIPSRSSDLPISTVTSPTHQLTKINRSKSPKARK